MRWQALFIAVMVLIGTTGTAQASSPGAACTTVGAQERDSGQILTCNGSVWVETVQTVSGGRSLFQIGSGQNNWRDLAVAGAIGTVCALSNNALYCWGESGSYTTGLASTTDVYTPTKVGTASWLKLATSAHAASHMCGIQDNLRLYCWGSSGNGQIGNGGYVNAQTPTNIGGAASWSMVALGQFATCGVQTNGTLWCWGTEVNGQHGDGGTATNTNTTPLQVGTDTWKMVTLGGSHGCGIQTNDTLWCWGNNSSGQVGDTTTTGPRLSPVQVGSGTWKSVSAGSSFTCGVQMDDTRWCWGNNTAGQTGNGNTTSPQATPIQIGSAAVQSISAGFFHHCIVYGNGTLWCHGENWQGQVGQTANASRTSPMQVGTAANWVMVKGGDENTCALNSAGELYCWGEHISGMFGTGSTTPAATHIPQKANDVEMACTSSLSGRLRYNLAIGGGASNISGLVAYWPMDEASGTSVADASGNGNTGTMTNMDGATDHVAGIIGNGLDFDGVNDYVNAGSGASLDNLGDMTVCAWVNSRPILNGTWAHIVSKYDTSGTTGWDFYQGGGGYSNSGYGYRETGFESDGNWDHYCAVNTQLATDGTNITIYMNNTIQNTGNATYGAGGSDAANNLIIGMFAAIGDPFNGVLDEVRIYNRALASNEISQIYNYTGGTTGAWQYCDGTSWVDF